MPIDPRKQRLGIAIEGTFGHLENDTVLMEPFLDDWPELRRTGGRKRQRLDVEEEQLVRAQAGPKCGSAGRSARYPVELNDAILPVCLVDERICRLQAGPDRAAH